MGKNKFELKRGALREIMQSSGIQGLVTQSANQMKASADSMGSGRYVVKSGIGKVSAHAIVGTTDIVSKKSNAKHNSLLKSISSGGV